MVFPGIPSLVLSIHRSRFHFECWHNEGLEVIRVGISCDGDGGCVGTIVQG